MSIFKSPRLNEREEGFELLKELLKDKSKCLIIHYSCESFITSHGKTPRVTSISIRNLKMAQTVSFSIHLEAQFKNLDFNNLTASSYDLLEKSMLNEFSKYVKARTKDKCKWIHWNMRDSNYGFEAINNRIKILKGNEFNIDDDLKYDLPRIIALIYTNKYENNKPLGRLLNLAERNKITTKEALAGKDEASAFEAKEYLKLHISTLRKVDIIDSIVHRIEQRQLKVSAKKIDVFGLTLSGLFALVKETPWILIIVSILGYIIGAALEPVIQSIAHTIE